MTDDFLPKMMCRLKKTILNGWGEGRGETIHCKSLKYVHQYVS